MVIGPVQLLVVRSALDVSGEPYIDLEREAVGTLMREQPQSTR